MSKQPQPMIVAHPDHVADRTFVTKEEWFPEETRIDASGLTKKVLPVPAYTVAEAAKMFFAKSPDWIRWLAKKTDKHPDGFFVLDGVPLVEHRTDQNFRYYTLADIERMAHALAQNGAIDGGTLTAVISLVKASCRLYGYT